MDTKKGLEKKKEEEEEKGPLGWLGGGGSIKINYPLKIKILQRHANRKRM